MNKTAVFGVQEDGQTYINKIGSYAVIYDNEDCRIALIKNDKGHYFLPGGGLENGESLEDHIDENSEIQIKDSRYQDLYFEKENQELGFNWILGKTATFPFDQLTTFERTLISLYDHKGMTYEQVGAYMGYHRDTIWSKRKQIKRKLKELMKKPPCN